MKDTNSSGQASAGDAPRDCGPCNHCCTAMHVAALDKPAGVPCEHQGKAANGGCGIYNNRPNVCRSWYCMWVRDNGTVFSEDERPDKLGVFFTVGKRLSPESPRLACLTTALEHQEEQVLYAHPIHPEGANGIAARVVINRLRRFFPVHVLPYRGPNRSADSTAAITPLTREGQSIDLAPAA